MKPTIFGKTFSWQRHSMTKLLAVMSVVVLMFVVGPKNCASQTSHVSDPSLFVANWLGLGDNDAEGCAPSQTRIRTWARGFGSWININGQNGFGDLDTRSFGASAGLDRQFRRDFLVGFSLGGSQTSLKQKDYFNDSDVSSCFLSLCARKTWKRSYFDVEGGIGWNDAAAWNIDGTKNHSAFQWNLSCETGVSMQQGLGKVEPFFAMKHVSADFKTENESKTNAVAGIRCCWRSVGPYAVMTPRIYGGVVQEFGGRSLISSAYFSDSPSVFLVSNYRTPQTRLFFGAGFTASMGTSLDIYLRYTAEAGSDYTSHLIWFGTNWNF